MEILAAILEYTPFTQAFVCAYASQSWRNAFYDHKTQSEANEMLAILNMAARLDDTEACVILLEYGVKPNSASLDGPLLHRNIELVKQFISVGFQGDDMAAVQRGIMICLKLMYRDGLVLLRDYKKTLEAGNAE